MRRRDLLHKNQLENFKTFCNSIGFQEEPTKGVFEVFRMRGDKGVAIFHERMHTGDHFTTHGLSTELVNQYLNKKRSV